MVKDVSMICPYDLYLYYYTGGYNNPNTGARHLYGQQLAWITTYLCPWQSRRVIYCDTAQRE